MANSREGKRENASNSSPTQTGRKGKKAGTQTKQTKLPSKAALTSGGSTKFKSEEKSPPKTVTAETTLPLD